MFHTFITMKCISANQKATILAQLDAGHSSHSISSSLGIHYSTVCRIWTQEHPDLEKSAGGHPSKLSLANVHHAIHLILSQKAENAVQITKTLSNIINQPLHPNTIHHHLKQSGMKAIVKKKCPLLAVWYCKACLDFAYAYKDWTVEDWKKVIWSDETKINHLGSHGQKWVWKKAGEGLSNMLVEGTVKYGSGSFMMWGCMMLCLTWVE